MHIFPARLAAATSLLITQESSYKVLVDIVVYAYSEQDVHPSVELIPSTVV